MKVRIACLTMVMAVAAWASTLPNAGPTTGSIYDLNGTAIPGSGNNSIQAYTVPNFTATATTTVISFEIREDPAYISLENTALIDVTAGNTAVASYLNGNFSGGTYTSNGNSSAPIDWVFTNVFSAAASGIVAGAGTCAGGAAHCWYDGSVQAYDEISQTVTTIIGDQYRITFSLGDNSGSSTFSRLSTNGDTTDTGGNGIDLTVYAGNAIQVLPGSTPEPTSLSMILLGVGGVGFLAWRRKARS